MGRLISQYGSGRHACEPEAGRVEHEDRGEQGEGRGPREEEGEERAMGMMRASEVTRAVRGSDVRAHARYFSPGPRTQQGCRILLLSPAPVGHRRGEGRGYRTAQDDGAWARQARIRQEHRSARPGPWVVGRWISETLARRAPRAAGGAARSMTRPLTPHMRRCACSSRRGRCDLDERHPGGVRQPARTRGPSDIRVRVALGAGGGGGSGAGAGGWGG